MRVYKIRGFKDCPRCGKRFGFKVVQQKYCSRSCEIKFRYYKDRVEGITLPYVPPHLMEKE